MSEPLTAGGIGCGWCGQLIRAPHCPDDGTLGLFLCRACDHFNLVDRQTGQVIRLRNEHDPKPPRD